MKNTYDIAIIGGGVVGSSIAREFSKYNLSTCVLEKELDVCCETSGRNSGVLHAGFNNKPGTLMAKFCVEGNQKFDEVANELDIPFKRSGKLVVGFTNDDKEKLIKMKEQGEANNVFGLEIINKDRIKELSPFIEGEFALYSPSTGILNPFIYTIAMAENAVENGVNYFLGNEVLNIKKEICEDKEIYEIKTSKGTYKSRWIINSAGLNSDKVGKMLGIKEYTIHPCRGEYFILDQKAGQFLNMPAYPVPNPKAGGLGIHLTPSIDGNVFIGPSSEYIGEKDNYSVTKDVMDLLIKDGGRIFPHIKKEHFIRNFSGIRPKLVGKDQGGYDDFKIELREDIPNLINLTGIESPGLTSAVPIAKYVVSLLSQKESLKENPHFNKYRKGITCFNDQPLEMKRKLIEEDENYGEVICRCETITKAEILEAINNPLGVDTVTGIKYRTRAMMGRCQGGYCQTRIANLIKEEKNKNEEEILYCRKDSNMFVGKVRV
ncbi:NAD(P)/FAD-dependent oxidoreductase [Terrisporobacter petrolearius]|uniref:NAD(P)/FAD-dependent oxidoreductase n=1 Tax=Terrisporobacter petrolearius TaxID=1460447 RepID=UPI001D15F8A8|nr:NAD(P)/FAD-dependent oxidoreductase [Terrisporobacter petrolearius]MCC3863612.1 NAD(P)/FAD-dependent oxidoreductase [Terrisporobacter petrolearius]